ncbi:MAG: PHP domain-containing protein [Deltaproteobacteria bacterium]|nr:PHP domain-containing protein [Deltaproteobacteria bacterium]MDQ3300437.1 PHP domain-containing protein [Myxococcota bacterium]
MEPATIAAQLRELAVYYELDGDKHRAFAYERAAKSVEAANGLHRLIEEGRLEELPGVGPSIARVVAELARRGNVGVLERLRGEWPAIVVELAQLPKVGVPKARKIFQTLAPANLDAVATACRAGLIREISGFGKISEEKILRAIEERREKGAQVILLDAEGPATSLGHHLRADPAAKQVEVCGPVRRWSEVVDHLAYAVASDRRDAIVDRLASFALVTSVDRESNPAIGYLAGGMRAEVWIAPPAKFGWAHIQATGSQEHVALLRQRAADRGMSLEILEAVDETHVYGALGLPFLPPEVRDGTDEVAAALAGDRFTDLITLDDLTAAFHCHTTYSDGKHSIAEMTRAAAELGFEAITITDHSAAASYAGGLDLAGLRAQHAEIAGLEAPEARILRGTEADILADGTIDVPPEILGELDLVIASVHQRYKADEDAMTSRLVTAMRSPFFKIWGHALGRMVLRREPIPVRLDEVLDAIAESPAAIEINGDPHRLDLDPVNARKAVARGIKFVLSSDAHSTRGLDAVRFAVAMARRARIRKQDVLNALPPDELADAIRPLRS